MINYSTTALDAGVLSRMKRIAIREAVKSEATLVHSTELWHKVNSFAGGLIWLEFVVCLAFL